MNISETFKQDLMQKRGWLCECGCGQRGHDLHHALIGRHKRFARWLDVEQNLILVNHEEHIARKFDGLFWRKRFYALQAQRYDMRSWISSLPDKLRHRIDFIEE